MTGDPSADSSATAHPDSKKGFNSTYWMCIAIEMWERLAYYTLRPVAPIYVMQADEPGGLHLTAEHKGWIFLWWFIFQSLFPMVTGGLADRYGYRKTILFSVLVNVTGYLMMAFLHSYYGFFGGVLVLAFGTAFFKPGLQATLGHQLTKENSSLGWGIFYWIVNVGSWIGHIVSALVLVSHSTTDWRNLFIVCAAFTCLNLLMLIKLPHVASGASKTENPFQVFIRTIRNIFKLRLVAWLLIMSCFWAMMYQLWDLQPNFIEDWVDSSMVAEHVPFDSWEETGPDGRQRVPQQILISLNALLIVLFMIPVSWLVRKMRTLESMFFGMLGATAGVLVAGLTGNGWMLLLGIFFFSLGEMLTGPKKNEYLSLIAPPGKKGLYLGYVNIPVGIGGGFGNFIAGKIYNRVGEKATLALKYLMEETPFAEGKTWDGSVHTLEEAVGVPRTEAFAKLQEVLGVDGPTAARILWDTYDPQYKVWIPFAAVGVAAAIALAIYGRLAKRWADMNA
ncbi:MAG: MFS transporter [Phycisphaerales bacterium]|nr:MAG: MFS transporter [Phycisphaerales bacterium]